MFHRLVLNFSSTNSLKLIKKQTNKISLIILFSRKCHLFIVFWRIKAENQCSQILLWRELRFFSIWGVGGFFGESDILFVHQCTDLLSFLRCSRCQSPPVLVLKFAQGTSHPLCQIFRIEKEKAFIIHSMRLHIQTRYHLSVAQTRVPFKKTKPKQTLIFSRL